MTTLLISKELYSLNEARIIAKNSNVRGRCRVVLIGIELFYCFGHIPDEETVLNIDMSVSHKIIFLSF